MSITGNLIDIQGIELSDTFNTWFVRTNDIIDALNPLQIYTVYAGPTGSGLSITGGGNSSGVAYFTINTGPGLAVGPGESGVYGNKLIVDFKSFTDNGLTLGTNPDPADEYIVNDTSDTTLGSQGTPKKIRASKILSNTIDMDGNLQINANTVSFSNDVSIAGDLIVAGNNTFIASNDLRIEDRQIELAYQIAGYAGITGVTSGVYTALSSVGIGYTSYYADAGGTADLENATVIGYTKSFTGPVAGPTAMVKIGSVFVRGTPADFQIGGFFKFDVSGISGATFGVVAIHGTGPFDVPCPENDFLCDAYLNESGIVVKADSGAGCGDGDKSLLWYTDDNAWRANTNLGVNSDKSIVSSRFVSGDLYAGREGIFEFRADTAPTKILFTQLDFTGSWEIAKSQEISNPNNATLVFSFTGGTGSTVSGTKFTITPGPSGQTFTGVPTTSFAKSFNSDMLDGAHGYTGATAYGIPIADSNGEIDPNWISTPRLIKKFTQASHGFSIGTVVRYDVGTNTYQKAYCDYAETAETIGVVQRVSGNDFWVVMNGYINGLSLGTTGTVYFLAKQGASGGLITNPLALDSGDVRKSILYSLSTSDAIVLGHPGLQLTDPTDTLYLNNLVPVGSLYPYAGQPDIEGLSSQGWQLCDGRKLQAKNFPELHSSIGQKYFADGKVISSNGQQVKIAFSGGNTLGFVGGAAGETVTITRSGTGPFAGLKLESVAAGATTLSVISLTAGSGDNEVPSGASVRLYGQNIGLETVFLIPDMRRRVPMGVSLGEGVGLTADLLFERGDVGGLGITANTGYTGNFFTTVHYLIRSKNSHDAVIITGHNHDFRYIRFDATHDTGNGSPNSLTDANRAQFRSNAKVLRNDGNDVINGNFGVTGNLVVTGHSVLVGGISGGLTITGGLTTFGRSTFNARVMITGPTSSALTIINGATGVKPISQYVPTIGGGLTSLFTDPALQIIGGNLQTSSLNLINVQSSGSVNQVSSTINFFGIPTGYTEPRFGSGIGFAIRSIGQDEWSQDLTNHVEYRVGFNLGLGYSAAVETGLLLTRRTGDPIHTDGIRMKITGLRYVNDTYSSTDSTWRNLQINPATGEIRIATPPTP